MSDFKQSKASVKQRMLEGVLVESVTPPSGSPIRQHPIIFVHGGGQGSWAFGNYLDFFAKQGWQGYAPNWFGHNGSDLHPTNPYVTRGIADLSEEISILANTLDAVPILIGHSMGGLAAQKYAEQFAVAALVLIAAVPPTEAGLTPRDWPIDMEKPYDVAPFETARQLFFTGMSEAEAKFYYEKTVAESPRCVEDAVRYGVSVDRIKLSSPILTISGENDALVAASAVRAVAAHYGADYFFARGRGHNIMQEPNWEETARRIALWLEQKFPQQG